MHPSPSTQVLPMAMLLAPFRAMKQRLDALETALSRRSNTLIFLVIRFLVMSAMVVGFAWSSLELTP